MTHLLAIMLCSLGGLIIALNYSVVLRYVLWGKRGSSAPLLGGLLTGVGMALYPDGALRQWAWVPFCLDVGCLSMLVASVWLVFRARSAQRE